MMSRMRQVNLSERMCSMLASEPVSKLSTQITRLPRRSSSSQRCEPRNPAPPVTRQVGIVSNLQRLRAPVRGHNVPWARLTGKREDSTEVLPAVNAVGSTEADVGDDVR